MKTIAKITSVAAGSCFALATAFAPALATTEGFAPADSEQVSSQQANPTR